MNLLTNICNPKDQHFQQESRTETYKPLGDYIFENRSMQKMRAKYQKAHSTQEFKYQSWNHPYSISNYFFQQKTHDGNNISQQQSPINVVQGQYSNAGNQTLWNNDSNHNKKISFKDVNMPFCGVATKQEQQGEKYFKDRNQFYATLQSSHPSYGYRSHQQQQDPLNYHHYQNQNQNNQQHYQQQSFTHQQPQNIYMNLSTQSYSQSLLSKQILQLKQQNKQLKRIIEEQYKPMKQLYNKLLAQQQQRQYLISKLQWKVKELVKEMAGSGDGNKGNNNGIYNGLAYNDKNNSNNINTNPKNLNNNIHLNIYNKNTNLQYSPLQQNINHHYGQNQKPVMVNQLQALNISTIPFVNNNGINNNNNTSYYHHQQQQQHQAVQNSQFIHTQQHLHSVYQPYMKQNSVNLSKSAIVPDHISQSMFANNFTQPISYQNNKHYMQNVPSQQIYHPNVSQTSNFQINKNY